MPEEPSLMKAWMKRIFSGQECCPVCSSFFKPRDGVGTGVRNLGGKEVLVCSAECRELFLNPHGRSDDNDGEEEVVEEE